jgi:predicted RNase H-like HicB family nuclease
VESLTLTARIALEDGVYLAKVDQVPIEATGASIEEAKDELVEAVRSWIQTQDRTDALETTLSGAGFSGVDEDTEVQLEFVE